MSPYARTGLSCSFQRLKDFEVPLPSELASWDIELLFRPEFDRLSFLGEFFDARAANHPVLWGFSGLEIRLKTERLFSILRGLSARKA
jgi:hypothetical protein